MRSEMQHVGKEQRERLVAHDLARAPHRMAQSQRFLLAREAGLAGSRKVGFEELELLALAALLEIFCLVLERFFSVIERFLFVVVIGASGSGGRAFPNRPALRRSS